MISPHVSKMLVSGAPVVQSLPNAVPADKLLFVYCSVHSKKGPCVLPSHITINLYDILLTRDPRGHFWTCSFGLSH